MEDVAGWLGRRAVGVAGLSPGGGVDDLEGLRAVLADVRLVGLGEATHGTREFFLLKHRLLEFLVEELGFTVLAMEASAAAAMAVNDYVLDGRGDAGQALERLRFWTWNTREMLAVIEWLRVRNAGLPEAKKVRFVGIDPQYPQAALAALRGVVEPELLEPLAPLEEFKLGQSAPLGREVEAAARRVMEVLGGAEPVREALVRTVWQSADLAGRTHKAENPRESVSSVRDRYLADNVDLLLDDPGAKVAIWAHNGHVMRGHYSGGSIAAMGWHLAQRHGSAYYALGLLFGEGDFRARRMRFGRVNVNRQPATFHVPFANTPAAVEARLAEAHPGDFVVDLRGDDVPEWLRERCHMRSFGAAVGRFTYKLAFMPTVPAEDFDGLAFVRESTPSTPLQTS